VVCKDCIAAAGRKIQHRIEALKNEVTPLTEHDESDDQALHRRVKHKPPDCFRVVRIGLKDNVVNHRSEHQ
jgi:hypothetical protein